MNILFNYLGCDGGRSGIGVYALQMLNHFLKKKDLFIHLVSTKADVQCLPKHERLTVHTIPDAFSKAILNVVWLEIFFPSFVKQLGIDVIFHPAANRRLSRKLSIPSLGTIHDLSQYHVKGKYDPLRQLYIHKYLPRLMMQLDSVVSVSQSTANDLVKYLQMNADQIQVIHNGADLNSFYPEQENDSSTTERKKIEEKFNIGQNYLLYTARVEHPGKNHMKLIEAFEILKRDNNFPDLQLVFAGPLKERSDVVVERARNSNCANDIVFTGFLEACDLPLLYRFASLFVMPSLFEGFGIPILEAMASGVPVVASNRSSLPEVGGECAQYFDPENSVEMAQVILEVLDDSQLASKMKRTGLERAQSFSWEKSCELTYQAISQLVSQ